MAVLIFLKAFEIKYDKIKFLVPENSNISDTKNNSSSGYLYSRDLRCFSEPSMEASEANGRDCNLEAITINGRARTFPISPVEGIQIPVYRGNQSVVGDSRPLSPEEIRMLTARDPITNLNQFFRCLDRSKPAKLTVYADRDGIGHAFITITQGSNVLTFGFYPKLEALAKRGIGPGILNNDSQHVFSTYLNVGSISPAQLTQIINLAERYQNSWYNLATHNCTTFTKDVMNILGKNIYMTLDVPRVFADKLVQMGGVNRPGFGPNTRRSCN